MSRAPAVCSVLLALVGAAAAWPAASALLHGASASREPVGLVLEPDALDLGGVVPGSVRRVAVAWRRTGSGPLRVLATEGDCGCVAAEGPRGTLRPGACGALEVTLHAPRAAGPFRHRVRLFTDAPSPRDVARLVLTGWVAAPLALQPAALDLGPRSPGAHVAREVEARWHASLARGRLALRLLGLAGRAELLPAARCDLPGARLGLALELPRRAGPFAGRLQLERDGRPVAVLPIRGEVVPGDAPSPPPPGRPGRGPPR